MTPIPPYDPDVRTDLLHLLLVAECIAIVPMTAICGLVVARTLQAAVQDPARLAWDTDLLSVVVLPGAFALATLWLIMLRRLLGRGPRIHVVVASIAFVCGLTAASPLVSLALEQGSWTAALVAPVLVGLHQLVWTVRDGRRPARDASARSAPGRADA